MTLCNRHQAEFAYLQAPSTSSTMFSQDFTPEGIAQGIASITEPANTPDALAKVKTFKKWIVAIYGVATIFLILGMLMNFAITARIGCCANGTNNIKEAENLLIWYWALVAMLLVLLMLILLYVYRSVGLANLTPIVFMLLFACTGLALGIWSWTLVYKPLPREYANQGCKWSKGHPYRTARIVTGVTGLANTLALLVLVFSLTKMGCPGPWAYSHYTQNSD